MKAKRFLSIGLLLFVLQGNATPGGALETEMIAAHNAYRAKFRNPPLAWSDALAARAQQWATTLIQRGTYEPRRDGLSGENLFEITGGNATASDVVRAWMSEEQNYNGQTNSCRARCGHFTQVIWKTTERVGCGLARNGRREVWICDYDPPGNIIGERPY